MKALVLSAGMGERLRPLTLRTPKPLLPIAERPLIHYPLLMLKAAGITEVAVNVHHLGAQIEAALGDGRGLGLSITYFREASLTGTGGPLLAVRDYLEGAPFVILNGDTIIDLSLSELQRFHVERGALATLALRPSAAAAYSRIETDAAGRIHRMRLLEGRAPVTFRDYPRTLSGVLAASLHSDMYCGVMLCESAVLSMLPPAAPFSLIADVFAPALPEINLAGYAHRGFFRTVDDLAGYEALAAEYRDAELPLPYLAKN